MHACIFENVGVVLEFCLVVHVWWVVLQGGAPLSSLVVLDLIVQRACRHALGRRCPQRSHGRAYLMDFYSWLSGAILCDLVVRSSLTSVQSATCQQFWMLTGWWPVDFASVVGQTKSVGKLQIRWKNQTRWRLKIQRQIWILRTNQNTVDNTQRGNHKCGWRIKYGGKSKYRENPKSDEKYRNWSFHG